MRRIFLMAAGISGALAVAGSASGQSIAAVAVVEAPIEVPAVQIDLAVQNGRLSVRQPAPAAPGSGSRLLHRTFVGVAEGEGGSLTQFRVRENGAMRLERRMVPLDGVPVGELRGSADVLIDGAATLTITQVIAANS